MAQKREHPATMARIATAAGVSIATVSRVLAGRGDLARSTRERVLQAADELGYERSATNRGRPPRLDPRLIELVLGSFTDAWTDRVIASAHQAAFRGGFDLVLTHERDDPADDWPTRLAARRPAGAILGLFRPTQRQLDEIRGLNIPVVLLDPRSDPRGELPSVGTTDRQGGAQAAMHLAATGARRFVVATGVPPYRFGRAREQGFREAIQERLPGAEVVRLETRWSGGDLSRDLTRLAPSTADPVGLFACNDEIAFAACAAARQLGIAIPEALGVVGFDDSPAAARHDPALTTIHQPVEAMTARAVDVLGQIRSGTLTSFDRIELATRLVVRGTTRAASQATRDAARG